MQLLKRNSILFLLLITILISCSKEQQIAIKQNGYVLTITTDNIDGHISYLYKASSKPTKIDSTIVENNSAIFKGQVAYPSRYIVTIDSVFGAKLFILDNDSIKIVAKENNLVDATIIGSELNDELVGIQKKSETIYAQMELLFPDIQRARLENDVEKLERISNEIKLIEKENIDYNFKYATENPNSFLSAMILNDLSKRDSIEISEISKTYNLLSEEVKKSDDSKELELYLLLQH